MVLPVENYRIILKPQTRPRGDLHWPLWKRMPLPCSFGMNESLLCFCYKKQSRESKYNIPISLYWIFFGNSVKNILLKLFLLVI